MSQVKSYKREETMLLKYLGASPTVRIIDFFLDNPFSDYSKQETVKNLGIRKVTFFKYWKELEKTGAVKVTRRIGRATMHRLDKANEVVKQLIRLDMAFARKTMQKAVEEYQKPIVVKPRSH